MSMQETDIHDMIHRAFPGLDDGLADEMIASGQVLAFPPGKVLCREGDFGTTFYIMVGGEVKATKLINDVEERLLTTLRPGDFFGEMALIHNAPRAATITSLVETHVLEITKEAFSSLLERSSNISLGIIREVSRRLRENDQMAIEDLRIKAAELADAYQQLAEQEYARSEFLTTVAHELRTPLTSANGYIQMIRKGALQSDMAANALQTVERNLQEIVSLVNDILFLQEMDMILPDFQWVDLGVLVKTQLDQVRARAEAQGLSMKLEVAAGLPRLPADPTSLSRAILCILDNAIKFSPDGGEIRVEVGYDRDDQWVKISDPGVGIPPEAQPHIFDRYFRLDQIGGHLFRGLGLGLSIAYQVVRAHNGNITMESALGKGSTFTIWMKGRR